MKFDRGHISPHFIRNTKNQKCELDDPIVLIYEKKISSINLIIKVLELALKKQRPLLIVVEDVESEALATLILNKFRVGIKVCAIKAPGFGRNRKANLQDLATLTDDTVVLDGAGDKKSIEERCEQIRTAIESSTSDYDKEKLQEKLAKLSGGIPVLKACPFYIF
ncbi:hypothetical protein L2E82_34944 [Cichorium intybus]|uniref:Uncharacterized protein n=1 Tax=Cichorium intybus TaxID=13427 RepID=A0ACB9BN31_CICIN|nr:hypothetical protein L2E82_34944 [Cichorium intybus]